MNDACITGFCSPSADSKYCFSLSSLNILTNIWNMIGKPIKVSPMQNKATKYKNLNAVLSTYLKGLKGPKGPKYWLWCGLLERLAEKSKKINDAKLQQIKKQLRKISKKDLKPEKPEQWYKNPKMWLSNYDIQNVMVQYAAASKYKYTFLGVFPIDFSVQSAQGTCVYSNVCTVDVNKFLKKGKKFIGLITNLDKHDESGSHWTSTFMVIDPALPTYGVYYYDSTGSSIPSYLYQFVKNVKIQCEQLFPQKPFKIFQNKKQHQYKNTECGVFSILYQIRWLNKHIVKKNNTSFKEIIANPFIDDDHMLKIRDNLFRPNTKIELKKLKLA
jgi:hypothetical protein